MVYTNRYGNPISGIIYSAVCLLMLLKPLPAESSETDEDEKEITGDELLQADYETVVVANRIPSDPFSVSRSSNVVDEEELNWRS